MNFSLRRSAYDLRHPTLILYDRFRLMKGRNMLVSDSCHPLCIMIRSCRRYRTVIDTMIGARRIILSNQLGGRHESSVGSNVRAVQDLSSDHGTNISLWTFGHSGDCRRDVKHEVRKRGSYGVAHPR